MNKAVVILYSNLTDDGIFEAAVASKEKCWEYMTNKMSYLDTTTVVVIYHNAIQFRYAQGYPEPQTYSFLEVDLENMYTNEVDITNEFLPSLKKYAESLGLEIIDYS